jgi:hypothetical protein
MSKEAHPFDFSPGFLFVIAQLCVSLRIPWEPGDAVPSDRTHPQQSRPRPVPTP